MGFSWSMQRGTPAHDVCSFRADCPELQNSHSCNASVHIEKLLNIDITGIAAHILLILRDPRRRKMFLIQRESRAQALLDLLQKVHP